MTQQEAGHIVTAMSEELSLTEAALKRAERAQMSVDLEWMEKFDMHCEETELLLMKRSSEVSCRSSKQKYLRCIADFEIITKYKFGQFLLRCRGGLALF